MKKICSKCEGTAFRRVNREGFWEESLLPKLGIFPWECVICRIRRYYRDDGHRPTSPETHETIRRAHHSNLKSDR